MNVRKCYNRDARYHSIGYKFLGGIKAHGQAVNRGKIKHMPHTSTLKHT